MKAITKIKDLLAGREKLQKYDELKEWKDRFEAIQTSDNIISVFTGISQGEFWIFPEHIRKIIVDALEAEIAKLDEE